MKGHANLVLGLLRKEGITGRVEHGGKHSRVVFEVGGRTVHYVCSVSSSDWRAERNCRARLRRMLRGAS